MLQNNLSLITCRNQDFKTLGLISNLISDMRFFSNPGSIGTDYFFPLYLYPDKHPPQPSFKGGSQNLQNDVFSLSREMPEGQRDVLKPKPNFNPEIIKQIEAELGMKFDWEAGIGVSYLETPKIKDVDPLEGVIFSATDLLDYIYAVLHSPSYREKYEEFLKIDFPRINFGVEKDRFWKLVVLGTKLRKLHLMESLNDLEISSKFGYPESGDNKVEKVEFKDGKVYVNTTQYFSNVPENVWNFYIGGYQPAQKWLKDRKGRELIPSEVMHYQKIVYVLGETERVMRLIDIE
jgi:predicted helicase